MSQDSQRIPGVQLSNYQLLDLEHANGTILFCESITDLESAPSIYCKEAAKQGHRIKWLIHVVATSILRQLLRQ